jgi:predicted ribosome quality control (RQC) complex YloA/Tae2 family protein
MNRDLASFDIYVIVHELQSLIGSYIEKVFQPTKDDLVLRVKQRQSNDKITLYIRNEQVLCITDKPVSAPQKPFTFAMTLKKYVLNGVITEITQHDFDRIIRLKIAKKEGTFTLVFELLSKGNMILLDPDDTIILPLKIQRWAHRTIISHQPYIPPPTQLNPFTLSYQEFEKLLLASSSDIVRTLAAQVNLSGVYAEEICSRAHLDKHRKTTELTQNDREHLYTVLTEFLRLFTTNNFHPTLVKQEETTIDSTPIPFIKYNEYTLIATESFTASLQYILDRKIVQPAASTDYTAKREKLERQLHHQHQSIQEFKEKSNQKKHTGDLIYLNYPIIEQLLTDIATTLKQKEKEAAIQQINKHTLVKTFDPLSNKLIMNLPDITNTYFEIRLNFRKTVAENAEQYYKDGKKLQEKIKGAEKAIEKTQQQLTELTKKEPPKTTIPKIQEPKKRYWFERFHWFITSEGNIVIGGNDAKSNDLIVKKYLKPGDRYAHADIHGAASCIIKASDFKNAVLPITEHTLSEACAFAGCHSKAWRQFGETQVYWVLPEQVSKTPQSGEFVPRGGFIIRGKRNYQNIKLEMAIGVIQLEDQKKIMCGPVTAVQAWASQYIVFEAGTFSKNSFAKQVAHVFNGTVDEIMHVLPPGDIQVIKTVGCTL